jgi:hypothetical protein
MKGMLRLTPSFLLPVVDDDEFWREIHPLRLSWELPELQENVAVLGYPIGVCACEQGRGGLGTSNSTLLTFTDKVVCMQRSLEGGRGGGGYMW